MTVFRNELVHSKKKNKAAASRSRLLTCCRKQNAPGVNSSHIWVLPGLIIGPAAVWTKISVQWFHFPVAMLHVARLHDATKTRSRDWEAPCGLLSNSFQITARTKDFLRICCTLFFTLKTQHDSFQLKMLSSNFTACCYPQSKVTTDGLSKCQKAFSPRLMVAWACT